ERYREALVEYTSILDWSIDARQDYGFVKGISDCIRHTVNALNFPGDFSPEPGIVAKSNNEYYNPGLMKDAAKAIKPAADFYGLQVEDVRKALEELAARAARSATARGKAEPEPARTKLVKKIKTAIPPKLPPLRQGLKWPKLHFDKSPDFQKRGGIVHHLNKVWRPLIEAGAVDMSVLRTFYPSTAQAIDGLRKRGSELPPDLYIPHV